MMKIIITIVSAAMAAFITIPSSAQTPTVASHSHSELEAFKAFKVEEQYLFQMPGSWKRLDDAKGPSFALAANGDRSLTANWVISSEDSPVTLEKVKATVAALGALMEVKDVITTEVPGGTKPFFTVVLTVKKVGGEWLDMRQAYHQRGEVLCCTTFTAKVGDKDADAAWAVLQLAPNVKRCAEVIPLITPSQVEALLRTVVEEEERKSSVPAMQEEMAQRRLDHIAHGLWYKPWTW